VGPRAGLDTVVKRKISNLRRESNPRTPIVQSVASRYGRVFVVVIMHKKLRIMRYPAVHMRGMFLYTFPRVFQMSQCSPLK
jgi:hypothetical protein